MTGTTVAAFEPALDYVVVKLPRFPFDKFPGADRTLGSQMKATGEVMAIDRTFGSALNKALRGLEQAGVGPLAEDPAWRADARLPGRRSTPATPTTTSRSAGSTRPGRPANRPATPSGRPRRSCCAASSSRPTAGCGGSSGCCGGACPRRSIGEATGIAAWFLAELGRNVALEARGRGDRARGWPTRRRRRRPSCWPPPSGPASATASWPTWPASTAGRDPRGAAGARARAPATRWSTRAPPSSPPRRRTSTRPTPPPARRPRRRRSTRPAALVIGSGPVRIGQGIEFDYCAVQAADTLRRPGWQRGDDQLEPGDGLDRLRRLVAAVLRAARPGERPERDRRRDAPTATTLLPAVVAFGGQTPLNLAAPLAAGGVPLLGSDLEAIDQAEERTRFAALLDRLGIPQPEGGMAHSVEEALTLAERIGYPVIVRPSFVIGGLAIDFCYSPEDLARQLAAATVVDPDRPVRIDRYLEGVEVDVDAVSDGERVLIPGLLEHVERAGVHSRRLGRHLPAADRRRDGDQELIVATMERIVLALGVRGLVNAQFIVRDDGVYLIEVNPRASRTVPFLSKVTGVPMVELAVRIALGATLARARLARAGCSRRRRSSRSRRRPSRRPSCAASTRRSGPGCSRPARSSASTPIRGWRWPRRCSAPRSSRRGPARRRRAGAAVDRRSRQGHAAAAGRRRWPAAGYRFAATPGTRDRAGGGRPRGAAGGQARRGGRRRRSARSPILELIASGEVRLVVNTPTPRSGAVRDAAEIRHAATAEGILCLTAMETAVAAAEALDPAIAGRLADVRSLDEWVPALGRLRDRRRR